MPSAETSKLDLSIVMPCLNEAETLAACIEKALKGLQSAGIPGEVIVADNGSTDGSIEIGEKHGARVVRVSAKGYGNALRGGIETARGRWILMGDADDSYDFGEAGRFVEKLREGHDLVMGCRLPKGGGTIKPGAMPWKNRWIGNPSLSFIGRLFFKTPVRDFHCGLRGFSRDAYDRMDLKTTGMEFASEMVMKASLRSMRISEVPITLHPDGRSRPPHLRPWRDGWRHLRFMLIYSPRWLFLVPGLMLTVIGAFAAALIFLAPRHLGGIEFDAGSLLVACMGAIVGVQLVAFAGFTKAFAIAEGLLPEDPKFSKALGLITLERGLIAGIIICLSGAGMLGWAIYLWSQVNFGSLPYPENLRRIIMAVTLVVIGLQTVFSSFFLGVLGLKSTPGDGRG
ncbi:MAG TPA: glycosyltransferase family 2 protein [Chthoniobacteraceae bacterium]|nr:glycosyltransferase family 2 protein [Chthoniobacteraceae bacterium]